jgi:hypothetical protein
VLIPSPRRLAAGALSLALAGSFLTAATASTAQAASAAPAPTTRVWVTKYHNIEMPDRLRPGVHRFVVRTSRNAGFQIIRPRKGYTKREALRDAAVMFENVKALKRFERNTVLMSGVNARKGEPGVMWTRLPRGHYWVLDVNDNRPKARKVHDLRVAGERHRGRLPSTGTIRSTGEVNWAPRPKAIRSSGIVTYRNNSTDNHFLGAAKLKPGKTVADFEEWVEQLMQGNERPAPVDWNTGFETGLVGPDKAMSLKYDVPPGRYVLVCWWGDSDMGGMPHVFMGMYRGITLR